MKFLFILICLLFSDTSPQKIITFLNMFYFFSTLEPTVSPSLIPTVEPTLVSLTSDVARLFQWSSQRSAGEQLNFLEEWAWAHAKNCASGRIIHYWVGRSSTKEQLWMSWDLCKLSVDSIKCCARTAAGLRYIIWHSFGWLASWLLVDLVFFLLNQFPAPHFFKRLMNSFFLLFNENPIWGSYQRLLIQRE